MLQKKFEKVGARITPVPDQKKTVIFISKCPWAPAVPQVTKRIFIIASTDPTKGIPRKPLGPGLGPGALLGVEEVRYPMWRNFPAPSTSPPLSCSWSPRTTALLPQSDHFCPVQRDSSHTGPPDRIFVCLLRARLCDAWWLE